MSILRPHLIGLIDGFGLPEKSIRSCLTSGNNVYEVRIILILEFIKYGKKE